MFRIIVLLAVLLAGCGSKTTSEPRIVKAFQNIPSKSEVLNRGNCIWETAEVSIFNQKDQNIKFDYMKCPNDEEFRLKVKNGNEIFAAIGQEEKHILSVWKTAPHTDKEFVESLVTENAREKCTVFQDKNNHWNIGLNGMDQSSRNGLIMYPPLGVSKNVDANKVCGLYGFNPRSIWVIGIKDGIGIAYSDILNLLNFYDLNSITYESRG